MFAIRYISSYFVIFCCSLHFFCCGLPFLLSISSISSTFGLTSLFFINFEWFEKFETHIYSINSIILVLFLTFEFNSRKLDCSKGSSCQHPPCDKKKNLINLNLYISLFFFTINSMVFFSERFVNPIRL